MPYFPDLYDIQVSSGDLKKVNIISNNLIEEIHTYLGVKPGISKILFEIADRSLIHTTFFNLGVQREVDEKKRLNVKVFKDFSKYIQFIVIREILRGFINKEIRDNTSINLILNLITIEFSSNHHLVKEWKSLVLENLSKEKTNLVKEYYRIDNLFKNIKIESDTHPSQFFFQYLHKYKNLISKNISSFSFIFFKDFRENYLESMINNELVEALRIIIIIFLKVRKNYNYLQYGKFYKEFKMQKVIKSDLSQRSFTENMKKINKNSYITLSYQINWHALNIIVLILFLKFHPIMKKPDVVNLIKNTPFVISPKVSAINNSIEVCGYAVIPKVYLDDFIGFVNYLQNRNIILDSELLWRISQDHCLNLNYFQEELKDYGIIDKNIRNYNNKNEIVLHLDWGENPTIKELSLLEFLLLNRIRTFFFSGLSFERRIDNINILRADLFNEIINQKTLINRFKKILRNSYRSENLKKFLLKKLAKDQHYGIFCTRQYLFNCINIIENVVPLIEKNNIKSIDYLRNFLSVNFSSSLIENNLLLKKNLKETVLSKFFVIYYNSKDFFYRKLKYYKTYNELLEIFSLLKIFNLKTIYEILENEKSQYILFQNQRKKLKKVTQNYHPQDINSERIDEITNRFIDSIPPIITPLLINTVITKKFESDYFQLLISDSPDSEENVFDISVLFPRTLINYTKSIKTSINLNYLEISVPPLNKREKFLLVSIIFNKFKNNLIIMKNFFWSGFIHEISVKNYYDFEEKKFFYTKDLFKSYSKLVDNTFKEKLEPLKVNKFKNQKIFWEVDSNFSNLVNLVNERKAKERILFDLSLLIQLESFSSNLISLIQDTEAFVKQKKESFYKKYIEAIYFFPSFQSFGLKKSFIYFYSNDLNQINFKKILHKNLLTVEYPASIDDSIPFLLENVYLGDLENPISDYILSRDINIREFYIFNTIKTHLLFHFVNNFTPVGWNYDSLLFKEYVQSILFDKNYFFNKKMITLWENKALPRYSLDSPEFNDLCEIFDYHSIDIKSYIGTKKTKTVERIQSLLKKGLILPYIKLKNLGFQESIYIIFPVLNQDSIDALIKIFGWFNYGFIHEIEGTYFIQGFKAPIDFKHGLMMEIYFPKCELAEFKQLFDMLFEYLDIEHYLILKDFVNGDTFVKNVYEDPNFFEHYHPLRDVKYEGKDDNK